MAEERRVRVREAMRAVEDFDMVSDNCFFITITLPVKLYKYTTTTQYELTRGYLSHILMTTADKYVFVPECTRQGNVHYHALVYVKGKPPILCINKIKTCRNFGMMKVTPTPVDTKESLVRCKEYLKKDLSNTHNYIGHNLPLYFSNDYSICEDTRTVTVCDTHVLDENVVELYMDNDVGQ